MARLFFSQPDGTDIEPYPFDGGLEEHTAAELAALIGAITGIVIEQSNSPIDASTFDALNFSTDFTVTDAGGGQVDIGIAVPLSDGDKGDITVSGTGAAFTIDNDVVTYAKMQNVSAASKLLGRGDSGSGDPQEITLGTNLSMSGTTLNATGGSGSAAWTEAEIDFGSTPVYDATFTVTDATVGVGTEVAVVQSGNAATDRSDGDSLWDSIIYSAKQAAGSFTLYAQALPGPIMGKRKILYQVGT